MNLQASSFEWLVTPKIHSGADEFNDFELLSTFSDV